MRVVKLLFLKQYNLASNVYYYLLLITNRTYYKYLYIYSSLAHTLIVIINKKDILTYYIPRYLKQIRKKIYVEYDKHYIIKIWYLCS